MRRCSSCARLSTLGSGELLFWAAKLSSMSGLFRDLDRSFRLSAQKRPPTRGQSKDCWHQQMARNLFRCRVAADRTEILCVAFCFLIVLQPTVYPLFANERTSRLNDYARSPTSVQRPEQSIELMNKIVQAEPVISGKFRKSPDIANCNIRGVPGDFVRRLALTVCAGVVKRDGLNGGESKATRIHFDWRRRKWSGERKRMNPACNILTTRAREWTGGHNSNS
jgi:hypothetical protein